MMLTPVVVEIPSAHVVDSRTPAAKLRREMRRNANLARKAER